MWFAYHRWRWKEGAEPYNECFMTTHYEIKERKLTDWAFWRERERANSAFLWGMSSTSMPGPRGLTVFASMRLMWALPRPSRRSPPTKTSPSMCCPALRIWVSPRSSFSICWIWIWRSHVVQCGIRDHFWTTRSSSQTAKHGIFNLIQTKLFEKLGPGEIISCTA